MLARLISPKLPTSSTFQYHFSVEVHTENLVHDRALAVVIFLDKDGNEIDQVVTPGVSNTRGWQTLKIEKLVPPLNATAMMVRLSLARDSTSNAVEVGSVRSSFLRKPIS